jgi:LmbE family N-acetylglucosaminyl deacetylase
MNHVYLSPHLDDAVLSCGGAIHRRTAAGDPVLVLTVFTGEFEGADPSPFARLQHVQWGDPPHPFALRRAEDMAALALLAAEGQHLAYLDAVYRAGPGGGWLYPDLETLFGPVAPHDPAGVEQGWRLADRFAAYLPPQDHSTVYAPLAVGRHVDHQIVRQAAHHLQDRGYRVAYYEDYPYVQQAGALQAALASAGAGDWRPEVISLQAEDLAAKVSALGYYRSQLAILFGGAEAMASQVWAFGARRSAEAGLAERIWWPREA